MQISLATVERTSCLPVSLIYSKYLVKLMDKNKICLGSGKTHMVSHQFHSVYINTYLLKYSRKIRLVEVPMMVVSPPIVAA